MRIAFLGSHSSVHTRRWVSFFAARGHDVHLLSCGVAGHAAENYVLHDLGNPWPAKVGYLTRIPAARRILRGLRPDLVHAHYATSYGTIALGTGARPLVVTAHGDDVLIAPGDPGKRLLLRRVLRSADLVTVPAAHMREAVERLQRGIGPPVLEFQYGVEAARLASLADALRGDDHLPAARPVHIVSARPLLSLYRVDLLIDALSILRQRGVHFSCEIIGDGPERSSLASKVEAAGLADVVRFLGTVTPAQVEDRLARADVSVSLSSSDGASLAVLEAMAVGAVLVLSDIPANRAWASPEGAVLVAPHPADVAEGIEKAAALDRQAAARRNQQTVLDKGDLLTNLSRFERVMESLHRGEQLTGLVT